MVFTREARRVGAPLCGALRPTIAMSSHHASSFRGAPQPASSDPSGSPPVEIKVGSFNFGISQSMLTGANHDPSHDQDWQPGVSEIVQRIFQVAAKQAATRLTKSQELAAFAKQLAERKPNPEMVLRLPSGRAIQVGLQSHCCTLREIQERLSDRKIRQNRIKLMIPGCGEPLPPD